MNIWRHKSVCMFPKPEDSWNSPPGWLPPTIHTIYILFYSTCFQQLIFVGHSSHLETEGKIYKTIYITGTRSWKYIFLKSCNWIRDEPSPNTNWALMIGREVVNLGLVIYLWVISSSGMPWLRNLFYIWQMQGWALKTFAWAWPTCLLICNIGVYSW